MGIWDNLDTSGNGFRFNGGLDRNTYNPFFAYTLGNVADKEWLSLNAKNLQELVNDSERRSKETTGKKKEKKNNLILSVPSDGGLKRWFETMTPENSTLRIYIYSDPKYPDPDPDATLVFYGIKKVGDGKRAKLFNVISAPAMFFTFKYDSMEPHKHRS